MIRCLIKSGEKKLFEHTHVVTHGVCECDRHESAGDIQIWKDDLLLYLIERKSLTDLFNSLNGRSHQKAQMIKTEVAIQRGYIIEIDKTWTSSNQSRVDGFIHNRVFKDKFFVFYSANPKHTMQHVDALCRKAEDYMALQDTEKAHLTPGLSIKKNDIMQPLMFMHWLEHIKGISKPTASAVALHCKSPIKLIEQYLMLKDEEKAKRYLENVKIGVTKSGKERRLGEKLSESIYSAFTTEFVL